MRKLLVAAILAAAAGALSLPAAARSHVDLFVGVAPPPVRYEVVPAPRPGWVWVPGVWEWRHGRYAWVAGHWVVERPGFTYVPARWVERHGRWVYHRGAWVRGHHRHRW
jgi:hypothetical protein